MDDESEAQAHLMRVTHWVREELEKTSPELMRQIRRRRLRRPRAAIAERHHVTETQAVPSTDP